MTKLNCQQPLLHIILQKSFLYIDLVLKKHILLLPVLKNYIFVETDIFVWIFDEYQITVTFDQFNVSLNKSLHFLVKFCLCCCF